MRDFLIEWVAIPLAVVVAFQAVIWLIVSFVAWDVFFISAFAHRFMLAIWASALWTGLIAWEAREDL